MDGAIAGPGHHGPAPKCLRSAGAGAGGAPAGPGAEARLEADLAGLRRLHELQSKLASETDLEAALGQIVEAAADLTGTDRGCVQLVSEDGGRLEMYVHRGYGPGSGFIRHFLHAGSKPACDAARQDQRRIVIEDVATFPALLGTEDRRVALAEGVCAAQSTPMVSRRGELVGVLSTQFRGAHRPGEHELMLVDMLAWAAADFVDRHKTEAALRRANEARQAFLLRLADALGALGGADAMQGEACRRLGEHLGIAGVAVGEADAGRGRVAVRREWNDGRLGPAGDWRPEDLGLAADGRPAAGVAVAVADAATAPGAGGPADPAAAAVGRAFLAAPVVRRGRVAAVLLARHHEPRAWAREDEALVAEVGQRLWSAVERARAEQALRASEERHRRTLDIGTVAVVYFDLVGGITDANDAFLRLVGHTRGELEAGEVRYERLTPPDWAWRDERTIAELRATGECEPFEKQYLRRDGSRVWLLCAPKLLDERTAVEFIVDVTARRQAQAALREGEARLRIATEANGIGTWELLARGDGTTAAVTSPRHDAIFGYADPAPEWSSEIFLSHVLPEDREAVARALRNAVEAGEAWAFEARIRPRRGGEPRWIEAHGQPVERDAGGRAARFVGVVQDVTARKADEERLRLLAREVDHRAKNALAVVQSVVSLTRAQDVAAFKRAVGGRISALARAQTLLADDRWKGADLRALLEGELAPFCGEGHRVALEGPPVVLPPGAAQPLAMAAHELATNALKYGALSVPAGRVAVTWDGGGGPAGVLRLRWAEAGGPPVAGPPARRGFGSRVLDGTVRGQLGGTVSLSWESSGLVCEMRVPLGRDPAWAAVAGTDRAAAAE